MAKTKNLGLNLTEDESTSFSDWRKSIDGNNEDGNKSNMQLIDEGIGAVSDRVTKTEKNTALLFAINEQGGLYTKTTVSDAFKSRVTAGGLNIVDGSPSLLKKVVGSTVVNEQKLVSASFAGIESGGRNLFNPNDKDIADGYFDENGVPNGITIDQQKSSGWIAVTPNTTYIQSGVNKNNYYALYDRNKNCIAVISYNTLAISERKTASFTTTADTYFVRIMYIAYKVEGVYLMQGSEEKEYEPYIEPTVFNFPKTPTPMGTTIDFENKKIIEGSKEIVLDGTENWRVSSTIDSVKKRFIAELFIAEPAIRDKYAILCKSSFYQDVTEEKTYLATNGVSVFGTEIYIYDEAYATKTADEFKAHLAELYASGNPLTVRYLLATPTETPFTEEQKASGNEYTAWKNGTERVLENDGEEYGADNTVEQEYFTITEG